MKKISKIFALLAIISMMFVSCSPDTYDLGAIDVKAEDLVEGIAFKIEHDASNPNIVYLTSLMDSKYSPQWSHPQGRSQKQKVTLKMPFPGTYKVKFGVQTRGGVVYGESATFTIDNFYADFVSDELWAKVSGGVGKSKTWYLDLDADGVSRHFLAPLYFFTGKYNWDALHTPAGDNYLDADAWDWKKAITPLAGDDGNALWYWLADWPGNQWMCAKADFGTMTFDLMGGANVHVNQSAYGLGEFRGSYMLNTDDHTIAFTDAQPLHVSERHSEVTAATEFRILYATENFMQIMIVPSGTCLNYISEDYKKNWVPVEKEPEPPYSGIGNDDLTSTFSKKWQLSLESPYNWTGLDGVFLKSLSSPADYPAADLAYNESLIKNIKMSMTKTATSGGNYTFNNGSGAPITGTYTIDIKNNIIFNQDIAFTISGSISLATTAEKSLRIIRSSTDLLGNITDIWLGQRSTTEEKYLVYHFELATSGGNTSDGTEVTFDPSKIVFGDIEGNGNLRIEIYNEYGNTKANPPLSTTLTFGKKLEVTFTLGGVTLKAGAAGSYDTSIYFADADWNPGGNGAVTKVSGNGTYTVKFEPTTASDGIMVFVVDVKGLMKDVADISTVTATVNKIVIK